MDKMFVPYSEAYKEACFQAWYLAGRPRSLSKIIELMPSDDKGRRPGTQVVRSWRSEMGWDVRADELDAKATLIANDNLVATRVQMLKEQASKAKELQEMGLEHLREYGFDSASSAVSAVIKGAELERVSKGITEQIMALLQMNDKRLTETTMGLLERLNVPATGEIIDVGEVDDEETPEEDDSE